MSEEKNRSYYSDASHNYMVIACQEEMRENYQYKMLVTNTIKGLLRCSSRSIDQREYLYYDITSKQSLSDLYDRRKVRGADLKKLLQDLVRVEETLTEYLLDSSHLILDPSSIYMGFKDRDACFAYYPGELKQEGWPQLFSFLADRVDGSDKQAAAIAFRLCMMAEKPGFRIDQSLLDELGLGRRGVKADDSAGARSSLFGAEALLYPDAGEERKSQEPGYAGKTGFAGDGRRAGTGGPGLQTPQSRDRRQELSYSEKRRGQYEREIGENEAGGGRWRNGPGAAAEDMDEAEEEGRTAAAGIGKIFIGGILMAAGPALFAAGMLLELEEREKLLFFAGGGLALVTGLMILLIRVLGRKRRNEQEEGAGTEEDRSFPSGRNYGRGGDQTGASLMWEAKFGQPFEQPLYDASAAVISEGGFFSDRTAAGNGESFSVGETSLLSPGGGQAAVLYGTGPCRGERISLASLPCVVGKVREYVDQVLDDSTVSRMHARFALDRDGKMTVRDLNSTNGTWINGERLQPNESRPIRQGDHIRMGKMEFVYR